MSTPREMLRKKMELCSSETRMSKLEELVNESGYLLSDEERKTLSRWMKASRELENSASLTEIAGEIDYFVRSPAGGNGNVRCCNDDCKR